MKRTVFAFFFLLLAVCGNSQVLTLQEAIDIALKNNLDIEIARNNFEASDINNHISIAGGLPEVFGSFTNRESLTTLNQRLNNGTTIKRPNNLTNALNSGIEANYLLFNGWRVRTTSRRLEALERQSEVRVNLQVQNVVAAVMVKYYDIVRQDSYINTIQQSIAVTEQRKKLVDARQSVGLANNADTYQAQLDLTASQQELLSQDLILAQAKADLMNLLMQRPDSIFIVKDTIITSRDVTIDQVKNNLLNNPEFRSADQQILINELIVKEIGAQRYPSVGLLGGFNYNRNQSTAGFTLLNQNAGPFVGLTVQVPIFNGGIAKRQQRMAQIDVKNATLIRDRLENDLETFAVKAFLAYQNTLQRLQVEQQNNSIAADLLDLVQQRFLLGVGTIVDVREAQRSFVEAGFRLVNLSYAAKVSEIELKRLASQLRP
jgi:outer membrane protein TolC